MSSTKLYPALYICHGGGPMPLLGDPGHIPLVNQWKKNVRDIVAQYGKPKVIAVVSAHYNAAEAEVGGAAQPEMWYDYYGFPEEGYKVTYPAPGCPALATEMVKALQAEGVPASVNPKRRFDHGVFVPLLTMFPEADIPVMPIAVVQGDDPSLHIKIGQALRPFRERGVFFLGSGSSMHHFGNFARRGAGTTFGDALTETLTKHPEWTPAERIDVMRNVRKLDGFQEAQPPGAHEHLMPLLTIFGTGGGSAGKEVGNIPFIQANVRHYLFED